MIYFDDNKMVVQSYKKILKIDENEVIFIFNKKTIVVIGESIYIPIFEADEFVIKGKINKIEISK